ncbi:MAG: glycosyltransferase family protein [Methylocystaceae bacterium]|nr:glycosyltransferase family protein [Methylocystaceae bacterium]
MNKVVATIEARMGARRLPKKTLMDVAGKTLLERVVDRLSLSEIINQVVVATTTSSDDDAIANFCKEKSIAYWRGSETDVLGRVYDAAKHFNADIIVQSGADCPFYDPELIDVLISALQIGGYAYSANDMTLTYPEGIDAHIMTFDALEASAKEAKEENERDDTPRFIWNNAERFPIFNLEAAPKSFLNRPEIRLTVDYPEDMELTQKLYQYFEGVNNLHFTSKELVAYLDANPELAAINSHCEQQSAAYVNA